MWRTGLHRLELFAASGAHQVRRSRIGFGILTSNGNGKAQAHGIVKINDRIDAWQDTVPRHALEQGFSRAWGSLRLRTKGPICLPPGLAMVLCPRLGTGRSAGVIKRG